ncbi:hypothetical protein LUX33_05490 [Actinomadura madurae]|uniref:hypothetical protein n=1 Tax=Actinomadura madurae TaxID=1993 RepID=UPI0020D20078|nr:hypothetical protein [Actinomadura madurae]MCP9947925.1 hypothetical protein [Actinomadura madurae]
MAGLAGGAFEGGPLLGDDDEPARQIRAAQPGLGERAPEDAPQRPGLGAVVRDHHQRPVQVPGEDAGHLVRIGGVEDGQPGARRAAERVGGQRGPPGRGQHDPVEAGAAGVGRQAGQPVPQGPRGLRQVQPAEPAGGERGRVGPPQLGVPGRQRPRYAVGDEAVQDRLALVDDRAADGDRDPPAVTTEVMRRPSCPPARR